MDLKNYYRKMREIEASIGDPFPVVRSVATEAGGSSGRLAEVARATAARMIADGVAEIAPIEEVEMWRSQREEARRLAEDRREASRIQFSVVSPDDLRSIVRSTRAKKE